MRETKAFASLTSGLLARKGQARPAMRAQGFGFGTAKLDDLGWNDMGEDLSAPAPVRSPLVDFARFEESPVKRQQDEIAHALAMPPEIAPVVAPIEMTPPPVLAPVVDLTPPVVETIAATPAAPKAKRIRSARAKTAAQAAPVPRTSGRKAAFTLRIDAERHLRLRLACAVQSRSAQQIVTAALDSFLADLPDVDRLVTSLSASRGRHD